MRARGRRPGRRPCRSGRCSGGTRSRPAGAAGARSWLPGGLREPRRSIDTADCAPAFCGLARLDKRLVDVVVGGARSGASQVGSATVVRNAPVGLARPRSDRLRPRSPGGRRRAPVRRRVRRADPARLADRRGDRARRAPHGPGNRRLHQRHVRERARADHRALRGRRRPARGRPRLPDRKRDREPPARARLLARLRRAWRARSDVELPLARRSSSSRPRSS